MDNCLSVTKNLLKKLNISYTNQFLNDYIFSHSEYPSLLAVSDALSKYRINNIPVKINIEKLKRLPLPSIIQLSDNGGIFYVLEQFSNHEIICIDDKGKSIRMHFSEFLKKWTGICLIVEKNQDSKEPGINKRLADVNIQRVLIYSILIFLSLWGLFKYFSISYKTIQLFIAGLVLLKLIGLGSSIILLLGEVNKDNLLLKRFCKGGEKVNCDSVLNSKYGKINDDISTSLIGFAYFFGTLIFLLINGFSKSSLMPLAFLSLFTFPIVILSAYYQGFVIKQWCKLCITVQLVLIFEFFISYLGGFYIISLKLELLPLLFALLLFPIPVWKWFKSLVNNAAVSNHYKRSFMKLKNNPSVFRGLIEKSRKIENSNVEGLGIMLRNKDAKYTIIKVCNPYCKYCSKAHSVLKELYNAKKISLQILFSSSSNNNDPRFKPAAHLLSINEKGDMKVAKKALDDWYESKNKDYILFSKKYPLEGKLNGQTKNIELMYNWCMVNRITRTPTIFINGYEMPKEYDVEDLKNILI